MSRRIIFEKTKNKLAWVTQEQGQQLYDLIKGGGTEAGQELVEQVDQIDSELQELKTNYDNHVEEFKTLKQDEHELGEQVQHIQDGLNQLVRKDESLKDLCAEPCEWANDLQQQITINGKDIDDLQKRVEALEEEVPSDQPSQSIDQDEIIKLVQNVGVHTGAVQWTASNIPENATGPGIDTSKVWKAKYRFDGVVFKGNEYLEEDTRETLLKWPKHRVYNNIGEEVSDYNIATEQFIIPKRHAINVIYNFGDTTNIKRIQTGIDSNHIKRAIFQIKPWYNVLQSHWSEYETKPAWKDLEKWIPIGSYSWDFVRDDNGYIAYEWLNYCDITFRYGDRGSLMLYVSCSNSGWNAETFLDNLIIEFDKIGSHLKITNDPTLDNQYKLKAYEWNEE